MIATRARHLSALRRSTFAAGSLLLLLAITPGVRAAPPSTGPTTDIPQPEDVSTGSPEELLGAPAALVQDLARETARAKEFLEGLERFEADLAQAAQDDRAQDTASLDRAAALAGALQSVADGSTGADRLYQKIVDELKDARPRLRHSLDSLRAASAVPGFEPGLDAESLRSPAVASEITELEAFRSRIAQAEERLRDQEQEQRWRTVQSRASRVERLNSLRIECLEKMSRQGRSETLGPTRAGVAQLGREIEQLTLSFRVYVTTRAREFRALPHAVRDVFLVGTATYSLLKIALILVAAMILKRRGQAVLENVRRAILQKPRGVRWTRRVETIFGAIQTLAPWSLFLAALWCLKWALGPAILWPELGLPYRVLVLYGLYRLAIDACVAFIVRIARRYELHLDAARTGKLIGSVRTIMRVLAAIAILLALSERFLGRGYLYQLVVDLAWVVVLIALLRVLAGWRSIIAEAYLRIGPSGRLERLVRSTSGRWYGVFVAAASFAWLAGRAGLALARDFALGFDQTRKALAFLFRRRMEKQAERQGYSEGQVESLPAGLLQAFSEETVSDGPLIVDHFPGLDRLEGMLRAWAAGRSGGSFLLAGGQGIGKTAWLGRVRTDGAPVSRVTLDRRVLVADDLAAVLAPALGLAADPAGGLAAVRATLLAGSPRVVIVDQGENLFLSAVGGYDAFEAFASLVESTSRRVFWICSFPSFALDHLSAVRPDLAVFRARQILPAWNEATIRSLIRARTSVNQITFTYEDLVVDRMEGISSEASLLETEEGYTRLLWDYSDGNPRVALHFWVRSLVPESPTRVRVRLFRAPASDVLDEGGDAGLFVLAAIVLHDNLTLAEAALATRYPEEICRIHLDRFLEIGTLRRDADRFRLTTHWQRAVVRLLKRKNLVSD